MATTADDRRELGSVDRPEVGLPAGDGAGTGARAAPPTQRSDDSSFSLRDSKPLLLIRTAHPRLALATTLAAGGAAMLAGRPVREIVLVSLTVAVASVILGWTNDLVDADRDLRHRRNDKPLANGRLDAGTVMFQIAVAVLLVVPLSVGNGRNAALALLGALTIGLVGQWQRIRAGSLSWVPWAASYALFPAFLSYGDWAGQEPGAPPEISITLLAGLLGIGVHLLTSLWGLVADDQDGWTYLPLRLGRLLGASRLLWFGIAWIVVVLVAIGFATSRVGLAQ